MDESIHKYLDQLDETPENMDNSDNIKKLLALLLVSGVCNEVDAQIHVGSGAKIDIQGGAKIETPGVIVYGMFTGDGKILITRGSRTGYSQGMRDQDNVEVHFVGNQIQGITGTVPTNFYKIVIKNAAGVELGSDQRVREAVDFILGRFNVRDRVLHLGTTGRLNGQTNDNRAFSTGDGGITATDTYNNPFEQDRANLGLALTANHNFGEVTIKLFFNPVVSQLGMGIRRGWELTVENPTTGMVHVIGKFFPDEVDALNGPISQLDLRRQDENGNWRRVWGLLDIVNNEIEGDISGEYFRTSDTITIGGTEFLPLPVTLRDMQVSCGDNPYPTITWTTATELNNSHFVVQRSFDGVNWEDIGTVQGAGTTSQEQTYEFPDREHTNGRRAYYRCTQYDYDGKSEKLPIVTTQCQTDMMSTRIFPNPAQHDVILEISAPQDGIRMPWSIVDIQGKIVKQGVVQTVAGTTQTYLNVSNLPAGTYHIILGEGEGEDRAIHKLIKQ